MDPSGLDSIDDGWSWSDQKTNYSFESFDDTALSASWTKSYIESVITIGSQVMEGVEYYELDGNCKVNRSRTDKYRDAVHSSVTTGWYRDNNISEDPKVKSLTDEIAKLNQDAKNLLDGIHAAIESGKLLYNSTADKGVGEHTGSIFDGKSKLDGLGGKVPQN